MATCDWWIRIGVLSYEGLFPLSRVAFRLSLSIFLPFSRSLFHYLLRISICDSYTRCLIRSKQKIHFILTGRNIWKRSSFLLFFFSLIPSKLRFDLSYRLRSFISYTTSMIRESMENWRNVSRKCTWLIIAGIDTGNTIKAFIFTLTPTRLFEMGRYMIILPGPPARHRRYSYYVQSEIKNERDEILMLSKFYISTCSLCDLLRRLQST